jgi:hypothetical protein
MKPFAVIVALGLARRVRDAFRRCRNADDLGGLRKSRNAMERKPSKCRGLPQKRILTTLPTEARFVLGLIALGCTVVGLTVIALEWPKRT